MSVRTGRRKNLSETEFVGAEIFEDFVGEEIFAKLIFRDFDEKLKH